MRKKVVLIIVLLSSCLSYGVTEPIIVDLPGLTGSYIFFSGKVATFDLGQSIPFEIGSMSLTIEGSYTPGVALLNGTEFRDPFHAGFASEIRPGEWPMDAWWNPFPILATNFKIERFYQKIGNVTWDFLSGGQAEIPLSFSTTISGATIIIEAPYAELTKVTLKITPVPEPCTILLLGLGGVLAFRRKK